jgi:hypothetical protein
LRSLSEDGKDWAVLTASLAGVFGLNAGLLTKGERMFALVDTGIPFSDAVSSHPDLEASRSLLGGISMAGTLWIPLDTLPAPPDSNPLAWSAGAAAGFIASADSGAVDIWRSAASKPGAAPVPVPFPLVFPLGAQTPRVDAIGEALEGLKDSRSP